MTQEQMNVTQSRQQKPGFFRRLLRALLKTVLILVVIAALAAAGWLIFQELRRSYIVVSNRVDRQSEQVNGLQEELQAQADQLKAVQQAVENQEENLAQLQIDLSDEVSHQDEMLAILTDQIDDLSAVSQTMTETVSLLNEGQSALQQDVIGLAADQDALGGEFDSLQGEFKVLQSNEEALDNAVATFEAELTAADPAGLRQAVLVFRLWELVSRARLRLVENNLGLAAADIQSGLAVLPDIAANSSEATVEPLQQVEQRLLMAADNLPDTPVTAANDLDIAWQELDAILSAILGLDTVPVATPTP